MFLLFSCWCRQRKMLVDRMPGEHVGRDGMRSVQSDEEWRQRLRWWFGVLLLSARPGRGATQRLLVDWVSAEQLGGQGLRQLQQNRKRADGVRGGRLQIRMLQCSWHRRSGRKQLVVGVRFGLGFYNTRGHPYMSEFPTVNYIIS